MAKCPDGNYNTKLTNPSFVTANLKITITSEPEDPAAQGRISSYEGHLPEVGMLSAVVVPSEVQ